jgi:hypothetical protein
MMNDTDWTMYVNHSKPSCYIAGASSHSGGSMHSGSHLTSDPAQ